MSSDKKSYFGDEVNDCMGVQTNNGINLMQSLWGCSKCLLFCQNLEKMKVHNEPCTSLQLTAGFPKCKIYLWVSADWSWCWLTFDEPPIKKGSGLENQILIEKKTFDIFREGVNH